VLLGSALLPRSPSSQIGEDWATRTTEPTQTRMTRPLGRGRARLSGDPKRVDVLGDILAEELSPRRSKLMRRSRAEVGAHSANRGKSFSAFPLITPVRSSAESSAWSP